MEWCKAHSIVVQKNRTNPTIRGPHKFYSMIAGYLLDYIFKKYKYSRLVIFVDNMPVNRQKSAFVGAMKSTIKSKSPKTEYRLYFPLSESNYMLQVADYLNWAIFRKWESRDTRSYDQIKGLLGKTELDVFRKSDMEYYYFK